MAWLGAQLQFPQLGLGVRIEGWVWLCAPATYVLQLVGTVCGCCAGWDLYAGMLLRVQVGLLAVVSPCFRLGDWDCVLPVLTRCSPHLQSLRISIMPKTKYNHSTPPRRMSFIFSVDVQRVQACVFVPTTEHPGVNSLRLAPSPDAGSGGIFVSDDAGRTFTRVGAPSTTTCTDPCSEDMVNDFLAVAYDHAGGYL